MATAGATVPADEDARLAAVRRYDVLDTPPDGAFDRITALAARLCRTPISTISIVDEDRIWFKSTEGIDVDEVGRDPGLCASAIIHDEAYVVTDAAADPRTLDNPLVRGELGLRCYAGIPLTTADGYRLGTLNVIDAEPREVTGEELATLRDLAAIVVDELELRLAARRAVSLEADRRMAVLRQDLMDGVSHEMRTPIAVLQGIASLRPSDGELDVGSLQAMMARHVGRLEWLVNQYLDFTRLEAGDVPRLRAEPVDLAGVVREAVELGEDDVRVEVEVDEGLPPAVASHSHVLQIVSELLVNAARFSPPDAAVRVHVRATDDGAVAVTVADEGPGVDPDDAERIFARFHRGPSSSGSGIGLYVSRALAEAQDGRLELDPGPRDGARFTLSLPTAAP